MTRSRTLLLTAALLLATVVAACGSGDSAGKTADKGPDTAPPVGQAGSSTVAPGTDSPSGSNGTGSSAADTTSTTVATTTTTRDPRLGSGEPVTIAFGGDVHFERMIRSQLDADPASVFAPVAGIFGAADLAMVNLETAITTRGTPAPKDFTFRAPDTAFDALRAGNIDVVSGANNHGIDFGPVGLEDSLTAAAAKQFPVVGLGRNEDEAYRPWITEVKGQRIAIIGATQVLDSNLLTAWTATDTNPGLASAKNVERLLTEVRLARTAADTVVVYLHWGTEGQTCPQERQQGLAPQLVEAGADIVVGGHAHRVQGGGRLGDAVVHYGLGNFVFYTPGGPGTTSGIFTVTATGRRIDAYTWTPARISNGLPRPLEGGEAQTALDAWNALRDCTGLTP